jgi:hypothetical protein
MFLQRKAHALYGYSFGKRKNKYLLHLKIQINNNYYYVKIFDHTSLQLIIITGFYNTFN